MLKKHKTGKIKIFVKKKKKKKKKHCEKRKN